MRPSIFFRMWLTTVHLDEYAKSNYQEKTSVMREATRSQSDKRRCSAGFAWVDRSWGGPCTAEVGGSSSSDNRMTDRLRESCVR
jgi:hypothetical protein